MIKQFNFYDIYGYVIPGMALIGLLWLPYGLLANQWPAYELGDAVILVVASYLLGLLVQSVANSVVPSKVKDAKMQDRYPSEMLLDKSDKTFSDAFKALLAAQLKAFLELDVDVTRDADGKGQISRNRQTAFFQIRSFLIVRKAANYTEQFEGMYAMTRGLACSFCAGAASFLGWALSIHLDCATGDFVSRFLLPTSLVLAFAFAVVGYAIPRLKKRFDLAFAAFLLVVLAAAGFLQPSIQFPGPHLLASSSNPGEPLRWAACLASLIIALRFFAAYKAFAHTFAETVWRDFSAFRLGEPETKAPEVKA